MNERQTLSAPDSDFPCEDMAQNFHRTSASGTLHRPFRVCGIAFGRLEACRQVRGAVAKSEALRLEDIRVWLFGTRVTRPQLLNVARWRVSKWLQNSSPGFEPACGRPPSVHPLPPRTVQPSRCQPPLFRPLPLVCCFPGYRLGLITAYWPLMTYLVTKPATARPAPVPKFHPRSAAPSAVKSARRARFFARPGILRIYVVRPTHSLMVSESVVLAREFFAL